VEVRGEGASLRVVVDGEAHAPQVEPVGPASFLLTEGARRTQFHCVREAGVIHLWWEGVVYRLEEEDGGRRAGTRGKEASLASPMPGRVIAVKAVPGQEVRRGDELVVVESMKMENALRAPRDGRVKTVAAVPGEMVAPGRVLVELA
jgi:acetyl/propionyl-CoA carboxylase alpha subunit